MTFGQRAFHKKPLRLQDELLFRQNVLDFSRNCEHSANNELKN